jgi:hypothetical protein
MCNLQPSRRAYLKAMLHRGESPLWMIDISEEHKKFYVIFIDIR